jgi:predicted phosphodiesterase
VRVAALYDVHGNLPALEAVLDEVEREAPDLIVFGGDVASGPFPAGTIEVLRALGRPARFVRGNADRGLVEIYDGAVSREGHPMDGWGAGQLDAAQRDFLASFEPMVAVEVDGLGPTLFCHATPASDEQVVTERTPDERVAELLGGTAEGVVVYGHVHMQLDRRTGPWRLVNAGSVGMPYEAEPGAYWALLGPDVDLRRTAYDLEAAADRIRESEWPIAEAFARENVLDVPSRREALDAFDPLDQPG